MSPPPRATTEIRAVIDGPVRDFLEAIVVPRRLREPRVAARLSTAPRTSVASRWGDLTAWRLGEGPAALLVHGWEDDSSLWSPLIDELDRRGCSLVAFDLPGHGWSGGRWGMGWEGTDAIRAVTDALGPVDAVVAHSAGCGAVAGAITEGWTVDRAALIAPPMAQGNRWLRYAERMGVPEEVALAAQSAYHGVHGPARATWNPRIAYAELDVDLLVVHSRDDERNDVSDTEGIVSRNRRARLVLVDGLTHRRTARDPEVISAIADFVVR